MRKMWVEQQAAPDLGAIERERDCPKYKPRKDKKLRGSLQIREGAKCRMSYIISCLQLLALLLKINYCFQIILSTHIWT